MAHALAHSAPNASIPSLSSSHAGVADASLQAYYYPQARSSMQNVSLPSIASLNLPTFPARTPSLPAGPPMTIAHQAGPPQRQLYVTPGVAPSAVRAPMPMSSDEEFDELEDDDDDYHPGAARVSTLLTSNLVSANTASPTASAR